MSWIYLNNAATSFPKPPAVAQAINENINTLPDEPGRSGGQEDPSHRCRHLLAQLFAVDAPEKIALLPSATMALNLVIMGLLSEGDHIVTTALEHNSVLRPLAHAVRDRHCRVTHVRPDANGQITPAGIARAMEKKTALVAVCHASNVTGSITPIGEVSRLTSQHRTPLLVDAAQSAGAIPIAHRELEGRVYIAFAGHKGLLGPTGIGGLVLPDDQLAQTVVGGTGILSDRTHHPTALPLRHEAGTPNLPGIAGLTAGVQHVLHKGVQALGQQRSKLVQQLRTGLQSLHQIELQPLPSNDGRAGIVSFVHHKWQPRDLALLLRQSFSIEMRPGLHCAPLAHSWLGTDPLGTLRASVGPFNTEADINALVTALRTLGESS